MGFHIFIRNRLLLRARNRSGTFAEFRTESEFRQFLPESIFRHFPPEFFGMDRNQFSGKKLFEIVSPKLAIENGTGSEFRFRTLAL